MTELFWTLAGFGIGVVLMAAGAGVMLMVVGLVNEKSDDQRRYESLAGLKARQDVEKLLAITDKGD